MVHAWVDTKVVPMYLQRELQMVHPIMQNCIARPESVLEVIDLWKITQMDGV
jgi:hypothetical protein